MARRYKWRRLTPKYSKGVGQIFLQTAIDCHSRITWVRLYSSKLPVSAAHLMNNNVPPTFEAHGVTVETVLSDNGREFCGRADQHPSELSLQLEDIAHGTARVRRPQSNGILEGFHRRLLDRHCRVGGRRINKDTPIQAFAQGMSNPHRLEVTSQTKNANITNARGLVQTRSLSGQYRQGTR